MRKPIPEKKPAKREVKRPLRMGPKEGNSPGQKVKKLWKALTAPDEPSINFTQLLREVIELMG